MTHLAGRLSIRAWGSVVLLVAGCGSSSSGGPSGFAAAIAAPHGGGNPSGSEAPTRERMADMRRFMDCNHNAVDGQETDVTSHAVHCGECGHACSGHCERGACTAPAAVVAVVAGAPGAPGAPATNEELVAAVVEALRSSDPEALRRLVPSDAEVREACPQRGRGFGGPKLEASLARSRSSCSSVLRGARVQVISAVGGGERESSDDEACPNLRQLRNVRAEIDIDGRRVVLVIDDPIRVGKRLAPFDPITCQAAGQEASPGGG